MEFDKKVILAYSDPAGFNIISALIDEFIANRKKHNIDFKVFTNHEGMINEEYSSFVKIISNSLSEVGNEIEDANVVVVNTCSFIETAREESIRKIIEFTEQGKEVIVAGCMAQHFKEELLKEMPEIKGLVGTGDYQKIAKVINRVEKGEIVNEVSKIPEFIADEKIPRFVDKK